MMEKLVLLLLLFCSVTVSRSFGGNWTSSNNRGYIFMAPTVLLAGEVERGCLSLHNLEPPAFITLDLLSPSSVEKTEVLSTTSSVLKTGTETCLALMVPSTKYISGRLRLRINIDHLNYTVDSEKECYIERDSLLTFVETDKSVYKPGQDVNIRILMLKHDLKPWKESIPKVWIENPLEIRVAQWTNVNLENGMVQLSFPLSPDQHSGTWKIRVEKKKSHRQLLHWTTFEVKEYVLPRFQLTVKSPKYILADADNVTWTICAKYSYGKPVKGTLRLKSIPQTPMENYEMKLTSPDGCIHFVLTGTELGLDHYIVGPTVVLVANFTEAGTGAEETEISRTEVMNQALKLEFEPHTPEYFKLGLPYHGKLRVLRQDDTPAPNEKIQLCLKVLEKGKLSPHVLKCRNFRSSVDGFIDFIVPPPHKNIDLLSFIAIAVDYPTKYFSPDERWRIFMHQPWARVDVNPWYSPSDSYLTVARGNQPIVCGEKYSFNVMYTVPSKNTINESISFYYSINSKGDLLTHGHVKHKPSRDTILNYSEFHNILGTIDSPDNQMEESNVVHRFPLSVKVTPSMTPVSELLLYYVRADGEVVTTTYTIEVGHCFENKVKSAWHTTVQSPGTTTQYHVEAAPWSLCGISAVDKSTQFMAGSKSNLIDASRTFDELKKFHSSPKDHSSKMPLPLCEPIILERPMEKIHHQPKPARWFPDNLFFIGRRKRFATASQKFHHNTAVTYVDALQAFIDFRVVVMSDLVIRSRTCDTAPKYSQLDVGYRVLHAERPVLSDAFFLEMRTPTAVPLVVNYRNRDTAGLEVSYIDQLAHTTAVLRSYFPETWLWELVPTGKEGKVTIERTLPHTITDWVGYTTCISPVHGLGIAPPTTITAFQQFFLDYTLPYSVKRGEMLHMKVSLFNYMQHQLPVKITLQEAPGLDLHLSHPTASYCVNSRDSIVHEYILRPRVLGEVNITVSAVVDADFTDPCGPETLIFTRDVIVKPILILPEGYPFEVTKSAFICPKEFSDDSTIVWDLILPEDIIPDSGRAYVNMVGNILGPALENLDDLVRLPKGCGEQNMVLFVPNIHVTKYLETVGIENPELRAKAIKNMERGYQRELNYRHADGSYSAFGGRNSEYAGSIWLTAFVLKSFAQARDLIYIDERDFSLSANWLMSKRQANGCFPVIGRMFHKAMKGGLEDDSSSTALTAYILISIIEIGTICPKPRLYKILNCVENGMNNTNEDLYALVLSTYAFALSEHSRADYWMKSLMDRATRHSDLLWWEDKLKPSMSLSIEMTAYAVLTLVKLGGNENMVHAFKAVRWMSKQRNANGGFISTQDTVLALEALTKYAAASKVNNIDLSVLVTASEIDQVYRVHNDNRMVLTQIKLPTLPTVVEIFAEGEGCVLVQSNIKYNVASPNASDAFDLSVFAHSGIFEDECAMQEITICARYKMADEESNMAVVEVGLISGYAPDRSSLYSLLGNPLTKVKRFEENHDVVSIYFDKLTGQKTCISFTVVRETIVDHLEPANVKLYDYYQQESTILSSYNFAPTCSSAEPTKEQSTPSVILTGTLLAKNSVGINKLLLLEESFKDKAVEKSTKNLTTEYTNNTNKMNNGINEPDRKSMTLGKEESIAGVRSMTDNVSFEENSDLEVREETLDVVQTTRDNSIVNHSNTPQVESGSGLTPDELDENRNIDFGGVDLNGKTLGNIENPSTIFVKEIEDSEIPGNPSFVVVNHELETPEGVEGPVPVYMRPDNSDHKPETVSSTNSLHDSSLASSVKSTDNISQGGADNQTLYTTSSDMQISSVTKVTQSCPTCIDKLTSNINDIYCSANTAVKAAIRRLRKARLLLDLNASREVQRLRATIEFTLDPICLCAPLDSPGSLALIINKENDILASGDQKQILNSSFIIYGLPMVTGVPPEITAARISCSKPENRSVGD